MDDRQREKIPASATDGKDGVDGKDGADGKDGSNGKDGVDGKDGITPQLKIESGHWFISYDNGSTWTDLGKATGEDGSDGKDGDSLFASVNEDDDYVYLNLAAGNTITIPKTPKPSFALRLDSDEIDVMTAGSTSEIGYSMTGAGENTVIRAYGQNGWLASIRSKDYASGTIVITAPDPIIAGEILILASNGENTVMAIINCVKGSITLADNAVEMTSDGGTATIAVKTNISYTVDIPESAKTWITNVETKSMRDETIYISIAENTSIVARHAVLNVLDKDGNVLQTIAVNQAGKTVAGTLEVTVNTKGTLASVLSEYDYANVKSLKINGVLNDEDFLTIYYDMPSLRDLDISSVDITKLPDKSFYKSSNVENLILPASLTEIGTSCFAGSKIKTISLGVKITAIGGSAFQDCAGLASITLPSSLETIGASAFMGCTNLSSVYIPGNVSDIGTSAFSGCTALSKIEFSDNVSLNSLPDGVFSSCPISAITIPASVATINTTAFSGCKSLTTVDFKDGCLLTTMGNYWNDCPLKSVRIPANVTTITAEAFYNKTTLENVLFEDGSKCTEIQGESRPIRRISRYSFNAQVLEIVNGAFCNTSIKEIIIPASVEKIGPSVFRNCSKLETVSFENNSKLTAISDTGIKYFEGIPLTINDKMPDYGGTFSNCSSLKSIVLPKNLEVIGDEAFANSGLTSVEFENGSILKTIEAFAFAHCGYLQSISIPQTVQTIGSGAFRCCSSMTSVVFSKNSQLKTLDCTMDYYTGNYSSYLFEFGSFYKCTSLTSVIFPTSITTIDDYSFYGCTVLNDISFPDNSLLSEIGRYAFYNCPVLHTVDMSGCKQITSIGSQAFRSSDEMRLFKIGTSTPPTCGSNPFGAVGNYAVLKVPSGSESLYRSASYWKAFSSITGLND